MINIKALLNKKNSYLFTKHVRKWGKPGLNQEVTFKVVNDDLKADAQQTQNRKRHYKRVSQKIPNAVWRLSIFRKIKPVIDSSALPAQPVSALLAKYTS